MAQPKRNARPARSEGCCDCIGLEVIAVNQFALVVPYDLSSYRCQFRHKGISIGNIVATLRPVCCMDADVTFAIRWQRRKRRPVETTILWFDLFCVCHHMYLEACFGQNI